MSGCRSRAASISTKTTLTKMTRKQLFESLLGEEIEFHAPDFFGINSIGVVEKVTDHYVIISGSVYALQDVEVE